MTNNPCACEIRGNNYRQYIYYCPIHANAFTMREALEKIASTGFYLDSCGDDCLVKAQEIAKQTLSEIKDEMEKHT